MRMRLERVEGGCAQLHGKAASVSTVYNRDLLGGH